MKVILDVVRVSALLHDVGKLECWANRKPWSEHVHYTQKFVRAILGEEIANHAMRHHTGASYSEEYRPKTLIENIVCLADNLASGADRRENPESGSYIPSPPVELTHVLNPNVVRSNVDSARLAYISQTLLRKLGNLEAAFDEDSAATYKKIFEVLADSELRLVPADTRKPINDASLWNHLKLTAAFATCIALEGYRGDDPSSYRFALLSGDADRISSFINESLRLPDLKARSILINKATEASGEAVSHLLGPECLLYAAGGSFLAISPPEMAEKVLDEAKKAFEDTTVGRVTLTTTHVVTNGGEFKKDYGEVWRKAQQAIRQKKAQRILMPKVEVNEESAVCDVCGKAAAAKPDMQKILPIDASPRPEQLCDFCWNLRDHIRKTEERIELDDIKGATNLVACIRADGDNMGKALAGEAFKRQNKASTPSRLSTLSDLLLDVCRNFEGLVAEFGGKHVFAGGDDLLAFVPGEKGLEAARAIASKFSALMADEATLSAGVAIFYYRLPVYVGLESANTLLSKAKEDGKNRVAFALIGGSGITYNELEKVKSWRWNELDTILEIAHFMQQSSLPSSQLRKIAVLLAEDLKQNRGFGRAELFVKHQMGRGFIEWNFGEKILSYVETGLLVEAFHVYKLFKGD